MEPSEQQEQRPLVARPPRWSTRDLVWVVAIFAVVIAGRLLPIKPVRDFFDSFGWLTEQALRLAKELFDSYGYLTVFLTPLLENTIFLGAIIPGTLIMLLAGLGAHDGLIDLWPAIPLGIAGAMIGDTISYGIGRFGWQRLGPESRLVRWAERMREPLLEHSMWLVISYHFAGYSRLIGPAASGFIRMPLPRWMVLDYLGVTVWVIFFIMGGYLLGVFGLSLEDSDRNVRVFEIILFALFIIGVAAILNRANRTIRRREAASRRAAEGAPSADGLRSTATPALDPADPPSEEDAHERVR
jgi:membrane protein DedA with SNARE-associated domain